MVRSGTGSRQFDWIRSRPKRFGSESATLAVWGGFKALYWTCALRSWLLKRRKCPQAPQKLGSEGAECWALSFLYHCLYVTRVHCDSFPSLNFHHGRWYIGNASLVKGLVSIDFPPLLFHDLNPSGTLNKSKTVLCLVSFSSLLWFRGWYVI